MVGNFKIIFKHNDICYLHMLSMRNYEIIVQLLTLFFQIRLVQIRLVIVSTTTCMNIVYRWCNDLLMYFVLYKSFSINMLLNLMFSVMHQYLDGTMAFCINQYITIRIDIWNMKQTRHIIGCKMSTKYYRMKWVYTLQKIISISKRLV